MDQLNEIKKNSDLTSKSFIIIAISILLAGIIVGSITFFWQQNILNITKLYYDQKITSLKNDQLQYKNQNIELKKQKTTLQNQAESINSSNKISEDTQSTDSYKLIKEDLINIDSNYPIGTTSIKGYYTKHLDKAWGEEEYCDSMVVTGGSKVLIDSFIRLVDKGNTVHDKNELNQPIVNLDISKLSESDVQRFFNSNKDNLIEFIVFNPGPRGVGVPTCYNSFEIIKLK